MNWTSNRRTLPALFGGIIALDFAIRFGPRLESLTLMSTFAQLTPQLEFLGAVMLQGLTDVGLPYMQNMLYPMNMSSSWIAANRDRIPEMRRAGYIGNDGYAMQNLMESFVEFKPLTPDLHKITVPTLIMNGEFDFFTPRECHELIRSKIRNSRLLIIQHAYHAFTVELPAVTMRQLEVFLGQVSYGGWNGDQSVWIASDDPSARTQWLPCAGDWTRAVQVAQPPQRARPGRAQAHSQKGPSMTALERYDQARAHIARVGFTPDIQSKIALLLSAAKSGNLMFHAQLQWMPNLGLAQQFIISQSAREMEALALLRSMVQWSPDPRLLIESIPIVAPLTTAWGQILMPPGPLFLPRAAYRGISLGHAQLAGIRLSPIIPENADPLAPFVVALQRMEQEDGRMLQTQIRLLKNLGTEIPVNEREDFVEQDQELVSGVFDQFLIWLTAP